MVFCGESSEKRFISHFGTTPSKESVRPAKVAMMPSTFSLIQSPIASNVPLMPSQIEFATAMMSSPHFCHARLKTLKAVSAHPIGPVFKKALPKNAKVPQATCANLTKPVPHLANCVKTSLGSKACKTPATPFVMLTKAVPIFQAPKAACTLTMPVSRVPKLSETKLIAFPTTPNSFSSLSPPAKSASIPLTKASQSTPSSQVVSRSAHSSILAEIIG